MGLTPPLKVFSTSSSTKQYQFFLSTNSSDKIRSHKKPFAAYLTNYTWRVKKLRVILIFTRQASKDSLSISSQIDHCYKNRLCIT